MEEPVHLEREPVSAIHRLTTVLTNVNTSTTTAVKIPASHQMKMDAGKVVKWAPVMVWRPLARSQTSEYRGHWCVKSVQGPAEGLPVQYDIPKGSVAIRGPVWYVACR